MLKLPHGGEVLGAAPANPILAPVLSQDRALRLSRQRELLDLQAIRRIPGLVGYWKADPAYAYEDYTNQTTPTVGGVVGKVLDLSAPASLGSELVVNGTMDSVTTPWSTGVQSPANCTTRALDNGRLKMVCVDAGLSYSFLIQVFNATLQLGAEYQLSCEIECTVPIKLAVFNATNQANAIFSTTYQPGVYVVSRPIHLAVTNSVSIHFSMESEIGSNVVGGTLWIDNVSLKKIGPNNAIQSTTANKPILRKTPTTGIYWADSNTSTSALNVALSDTVLGRRNLLQYSEQLEAGWTKTRVSIGVDSTTTWDGVQIADKVIEDTSSAANHYLTINSLVVGATTTINLEVKSAERSVIEIKAGSSTTTALWFDATNNTFSTIGGAITAYSSSALGSGWYRIKFTCVPPSSTALTISLINGSSNYTGDGTSGIYITRIQAELGSVATDYQKITNVPAYCTLARATAEGVTFTENVSITSTYNIAPAFSFNADVAIFNRTLTDVEKALITRYMARAVPMLGSNLFVNPGFDTDTAWVKNLGWTIGTGVATKSPSAASALLTQGIGTIGNQYFSSVTINLRAGFFTFWNAGLSKNALSSGYDSAVYSAIGVSLGYRGGITTDGDIDNAVLKEIL